MHVIGDEDAYNPSEKLSREGRKSEFKQKHFNSKVKTEQPPRKTDAHSRIDQTKNSIKIEISKNLLDAAAKVKTEEKIIGKRTKHFESEITPPVKP